MQNRSGPKSLPRTGDQCPHFLSNVVRTVYVDYCNSVLAVPIRKEMLKAPSSSSPTLDADKPVQEQMTSESEEPFSDHQTADVDNELSYEEE